MQVWHGMAFELMSISMPFLNFATVFLGRVSIYTGICHYTDKITVSHLFWCALLLLIISSFSPSLFFCRIFRSTFLFFYLLPYKIFRFEILFGMVGLVWCVSSHRVHNSLIYYIYKIWRNSVVAFLQCVWLFNFCSVFFLKNRWYKCGRSSQAKQTQWCVCVYLCIFRSYSDSLSFLLAFFLPSLYGGVFVCVYISSSLNIFVFFFLLSSRLHSIFEDGAPQVHIISSRAQTSIAIPNSSCVLCHRAMLYLPLFSTIRHTTLWIHPCFD